MGFVSKVRGALVEATPAVTQGGWTGSPGDAMGHPEP